MKNKYNLISFGDDYLSLWFFQTIEKALLKSDMLDFVFDLSGTQFKHTLSLTTLFSEDSKGYQWAKENSKDFTKVLDVIQGINVDEPEKPIYRLHFKFDKTVFHESMDFTNIRCYSLSFEDTIFHKDVKFAFVDVEEFIYKPYQLDVDVTFFHREKANMTEGKLRGEIKGRIGTFTFRHYFLGTGKTYFVGVNFDKKAFFQDVNLENVVFWYIDRESMSKCYFSNSFLENTQFYKCEFDYVPNKMSILALLKRYLFAFILFSSSLSILFFYGAYQVPNKTSFELFSIIDGFSALCIALLLVIMTNLAFMWVMYYIQKISSWFTKIYSPFEMFESLNQHICVADDHVKNDNLDQQEENFQCIREIYRQLRINHEKHGDWQLAGEFYYSQRYCEMISKMNFFKGQLQHILLNAHHVVNGFGERWLRSLVWGCVALGMFAWFGGEPNRDYVSTKSTPEYLLIAHKPMSKDENASDYNRTYYQEFNESTETITENNVSGQAHFMLYSKTSYRQSDKDENVTGKPKTIFAYDNRFDYHYTEQYIPMLKSNIETRILHSLSKFVSPFTSAEKQWFQDRSGKAYLGGFVETMLLWLFFGGFVLAVKNKIKR